MWRHLGKGLPCRDVGLWSPRQPRLPLPLTTRSAFSWGGFKGPDPLPQALEGRAPSSWRWASPCLPRQSPPLPASGLPGHLPSDVCAICPWTSLGGVQPEMTWTQLWVRAATDDTAGSHMPASLSQEDPFPQPRCGRRRRCWGPGERVEQREGKDRGGLRGRKPGEQEWAGQPRGDPHPLQGSAPKGAAGGVDSVDPEPQRW